MSYRSSVNSAMDRLHYAVQRGDSSDAVRTLCRELWPEVSMIRGLTLAHVAAQGGHTDTLRVLVKELGANVNTVETSNGMTPLHFAAQGGHVETVRALVNEMGADVNAVDKEQRTRLHCALETVGRSRGGIETALVLVTELGADVKAVDKCRAAPLHYAAGIAEAEEALELVRTLVRRRCEQSGQEQTLFEKVCGTSTRQRVCWLSLVPESMPQTILHYAVQTKMPDMVRFIVEELGANPNIADRDNNTPLHCAVDAVGWAACSSKTGPMNSAVSADGETPIQLHIKERQCEHRNQTDWGANMIFVCSCVCTMRVWVPESL